MNLTTRKFLPGATLGLGAALAALHAAPCRAAEGDASAVASPARYLAPKPNDHAKALLLLASAKPGEPAARPAQIPDPVGVIGSTIPLRIRLGISYSPTFKFVGGVDFTVPGLSLGKGFATRLDAEVVPGWNRGGNDILIPVTINQVYSKGIIGGVRVYSGLGIGAYIGDTTRFGGKLFAGTEYGSRLGVETSVNFTGYGDALLTIQARVPLGR